MSVPTGIARRSSSAASANHDWRSWTGLTRALCCQSVLGVSFWKFQPSWNKVMTDLWLTHSDCMSKLLQVLILIGWIRSRNTNNKALIALNCPSETSEIRTCKDRKRKRYPWWLRSKYPAAGVTYVSPPQGLRESQMSIYDRKKRTWGIPDFDTVERCW